MTRSMSVVWAVHVLCDLCDKLCRNMCDTSRLSLEGNLFTSTIPDGIDLLDKLQVVDLSGNALSGTIPSKITVGALGVWCSVVWTVWCGVVGCDVVWWGVVWCGVYTGSPRPNPKNDMGLFGADGAWHSGMTVPSRVS